MVGARVLVELSPALPSSIPIIEGRSYRVGQIGSFVRIPLGFLNLYGIVSMVGASEVPQSEVHGQLPPAGQRWLEVQLVGESYGRRDFQRGVSLFPTLEDEVHIVTEHDLTVIYGERGPGQIQLGSHATSANLPATVSLDKLVTRHAAVIGSTGSGKSNAIACLLKALTEGNYPSARVVVVDPHGEYRAAFQDRARVFSIGGSVDRLVVPYWALSFDELAWFLIDRRQASESLQESAIRAYMSSEKQRRCSDLKAGLVDPNSITADAPIPFGLRELWYHFDRQERVTYKDMGRTDEALLEEGNAATLSPARFEPPGVGSTPPYKPNPGTTLNMGSNLNKILARLKDKRFEFLLDPGRYNGSDLDLDDLLRSWIDHGTAITVLDLGGVPSDVMDLIVGVITRILFESMFWGRSLEGTGRQRPLLLVYEEAHSYLPRKSGEQFVAGYAARAVRRVFKEGRKYGVGAVVVSQRPSELDETVLSQCGTFFTLRLSNSDDQSRVRSVMPDSLAGMVELLPALRTGEALVIGEAVVLPTRIRLPLTEPRPKSSDPEVHVAWSKERKEDVQYSAALTDWRRQGLKHEN